MRRGARGPANTLRMHGRLRPLLHGSPGILQFRAQPLLLRQHARDETDKVPHSTAAAAQGSAAAAAGNVASARPSAADAAAQRRSRAIGLLLLLALVGSRLKRRRPQSERPAALCRTQPVACPSNDRGEAAVRSSWLLGELRG